MQHQPNQTKQCATCGEVKPLTEFKCAPRSRDGHRHSCKICTFKPRAKDDQAKRREWGRRWVQRNLLRHTYGNTRGFTVDDRAYIAALRDDPCAYCGGPSNAIDHIVAGAERGWTNLTAVCRRCNGSKQADGLLLWMATVRRTHHDLDRIAQRAAAGETHRDIAADYGVSRPQISALMRRYRRETHHEEVA